VPCPAKALLLPQKMSWPGFRASSADLLFLRQLSTDAGSNGDDGGGSRLDGRRTNRTKVLRSSHNTDMADNIHTDNTHIHSRGSHSCSTPGIQIRSRPTHLRQSAVLPQKRIRLPPTRLREVFSNSYNNLPPSH